MGVPRWITKEIDPKEQIQTVKGVLSGRSWIESEFNRMISNGSDVKIVTKDNGNIALLHNNFEDKYEEIHGRKHYERHVLPTF